MGAQEEYLRAQRTFFQQKVDSDSVALMRGFLGEVGFPASARNVYYDRVGDRIIGDYDPELIFREVFPTFPFHLILGPLDKSKMVTRLDHLQGRYGGEINTIFERKVEEGVESLALGIPALMVLRLPYFKKLHVWHALDHEVVDLREGGGNFWTIKSSYNYWITVQPLEFFIKLSKVREALDDFFSEFTA